MGTTKCTVGAETAKLAGLQADLCQKIRNGQLSLEQVEFWLNLSYEVRVRYTQPDFRSVANGLATITLIPLALALDKALGPSSFIGEKWTFWKGPADGDGTQGDEDYVSEPDTVDFAQLVCETHLQGKETTIDGEEKVRRTRTGANRQLGDKTFLALWNNWLACQTAGKPEDSILECLWRSGKIKSIIYFFGRILRDPSGYRYVLFLYRSGGGLWHWDYNWLGNHWNAGSPSIALASVKTQP